VSSALLITLELGLVLGVVVGLAAWDLWRLRRDQRNSRDAASEDEPRS
jgi:hypothetical protein